MTPATIVSGAGASPWEALLVGSLLARHSGVQVLARCFDVAQVLAAARRVHPDVVLVGHDLEALDREVVALLRSQCRAVVGAYPPDDPVAVRRLIDLGCDRAVPHDLDPLDLARLVLELAGRPTRLDAPPPGPAGRMVAVWGPAGAPGRTTVAVNLAALLGRRGAEVLLVDADPYGGAVAQGLGLPEQPSLVGAVRAAATNAFGAPELTPFCISPFEGVQVLVGIRHPDLWTEIREASFRAVLAAAREAAPITVVDCGFCLEEDEELSFTGVPLRRNLTTRTALAEADAVVGVCRADPVGLRRYLESLEPVRAVTRAPLVTVVNRSPDGVPGRLKMDMSLTIERHTGRPAAAFVPDDAAVGQSLWEGQALVRERPRSAAARALAPLAEAVLAAIAPPADVVAS